MSEHGRGTAQGGIYNAGLGDNRDGAGELPDGSDPSGFYGPERTDFGIDTFGQWSIEVRAADGKISAPGEQCGPEPRLDRHPHRVRPQRHPQP